MYIKLIGHWLCVNTPGSFTCDCDRGYELDTRRCTHVDHQNLYPHETCETNHICVNTDECQEGTDLCGLDFHCHDRSPFFICCSQPHRHPYECVCPPYYTKLNNGHACLWLICDDGWRLNDEKTFCIDIDECQEGTDGCSEETFCINNHGSFECSVCDVGFEQFVSDPDNASSGDPPEGTCVDIDECTVTPNICQFGECVNTVGSYECNCWAGYGIDVPDPETGWSDRRCQLIDHREEHEHRHCEYNPTCLDINECDVGTDLCRDDYHCGNREPFFFCCYKHDSNQCECPFGYVRSNQLSTQCYLIVCHEGYELNDEGTFCIDIDECSRETDDCSVDSHCRNNEGSFTCELCPFGYEWPMETICTEVDGVTECEDVESSGEWFSGGGSGEGTLVPAQCQDIDECANDPNLCRNGFCTNTAGGYYCTCDAGYEQSWRRCHEQDLYGPFPERRYGNQYPHEFCELYETCVNRNECEDDSDLCDPAYHCYDKTPFFTCLSQGWLTQWCPANYILANYHGTFHGDPRPCLLIVCHEGYELNNLVDHVTFDTSYREGKVCIDLDECALGTHDCEEGSSTADPEYCVNNEGSYTCEVCPKGYEMVTYEVEGSGGTETFTECRDIDECALPDTPSCIKGTCLNTEGTYTCDCLPGFEIESRRCSYNDISGPYGNEYPHETCTYHPTCIDIDECALGVDNCAPHLICTNLQPWFQCCYQHWYNWWHGAYRNYYWTCACPSTYVQYNHGGPPQNPVGCTPIICEDGYTLDPTGYFCTDENECETGSHTCAENESCVNLQGHEEGKYRCEPCPLGYEMVTVQVEQSAEGSTGEWDETEMVDVQVCQDVDECSEGSPCSGGGCVNTEGSYICTCSPGYESGTPSRCWTGDRGEYPHQTCDFSPICIDINECELGTDLCRVDYHCHNMSPYFRCSNYHQNHHECPYGWTLQHSGRCIPLVCEPGYRYNEPFTLGIHNCIDIDECAEGTHECEEGSSTTDMEYCINNEGSYTCEECPTGFEKITYDQEGSGGEITTITECVDINECERGTDTCLNLELQYTADPTDYANYCVNTIGSFTCECVKGMELRGENCYNTNKNSFHPHWTCNTYPHCVDQDECERGTDTCPLDTECFNTNPFFQCCKHYSNYWGWRFRCTCPPHYVRFNSDGYKFRCQYIYCHDGFDIDPPGMDYVETLWWVYQDVDSITNHDEQMCKDVDECALGLHDCEEGSSTTDAEYCINNDGSYTCETCPTGYKPHTYEVEGSGGTESVTECVDIDECVEGVRYAGGAVGPADCDGIHAGVGTCVNTEGTYTCTCEHGYELTHRARCTQQDHRTHELYNTEQPHAYCDYRPHCIDIDECLTETDNCPTNTECINKVPYFQCCTRHHQHHNHIWWNHGQCECPPGWVMKNVGPPEPCRPIICNEGYELNEEGRVCIDINECETGRPCDRSTSCVNNEGSYTCEACPAGYEIPMETVCDEDGNNCVEVESSGEWFSGDDGGYLVPPDCVDINECEVGHPVGTAGINCGPGQCTNTPGSYHCSCDWGYHQIFNNCVNVDIGIDNEMPHQTCVDVRPSCTNTNECALDTDLCPANTKCDDRTPHFQCCQQSHYPHYYGEHWYHDTYYDLRCFCPVGYTLHNTIGRNNKYEAVPCINIICDPGYEFYAEENGCIDVDECVLGTHDCVLPLACNNNEGSFSCEICPVGYEATYREEPDAEGSAMDTITVFDSCQEINECDAPDAEFNLCSGRGNCVNTDGSFTCDCDYGHTLEEFICTYTDRGENSNSPHKSCDYDNKCLDTDECELGIDFCETPYKCYNMSPGFRCCDYGDNSCVCPPGFVKTNDSGELGPCIPILCRVGFEITADQTKCIDVDECTRETHDCTGGTFCVNTEGSFTCDVCAEGYELDDDGVTCKDIDECLVAENVTNCGPGACVNTVGTYVCDCDPGYEFSNAPDCTTTDINKPPSSAMEHPHDLCFDYPRCLNIDECDLGTDKCHVDTWCQDEDPFFRCCEEDGTTCYCPPTYVLSNTSSKCVFLVCDVGYVYDETEYFCTDDDECANGTDDCAGGLVCINTDGSFTCEDCQTGYRMVDGACTEIDECSEDDTLCSNGSCVNTDGSFECTCELGYEFRNTLCVTNDRGEYPHQTCTYQPECVTINFCALATDNCPAAKRCVYTDPYFTCCDYPDNVNCVCPPGWQVKGEYTKDGAVPRCEKMECDAGYQLYTGVSDTRATDIYPWGWIDEDRDISRCVDIDECFTGTHDCAGGDFCINENGSFRCEVCDEGFKYDADSDSCIDVDECTENGSNPCHIDGEETGITCTNLEGGQGYECDCGRGENDYVMTNLCWPRSSDWPGTVSSARDGFHHEHCMSPHNNFNPVCYLHTPTCSDLPFATECPDGFTCQAFGDGTRFRCCQNLAPHVRSRDDAMCDCVGSMKPDRSCVGECNAGYEFRTDRCVDIDECALGTHNCRSAESCVNDIPENDARGYYCQECDAGYYRDAQGICVDVDECAADGCGGRGVCTNTEGSYTCDCGPGYEMNPTGCTLVVTGGTDPDHEQCVGATCINIDECATGTHQCREDLTCYDTNPHYRCCTENIHPLMFNDNVFPECECPIGTYINEDKSNQDMYQVCMPIVCDTGYEFYADGNYCINIDECDRETHNCVGMFCSDTYGSFTCESCIPGYTRNWLSQCVDKDECTNGEADCGMGTCINFDGGFECDCNPGYREGVTDEDLCGVNNYHQSCITRTCLDINECADETHSCRVNLNCYNHGPWFKCCTNPWAGDCDCPNAWYEYTCPSSPNHDACTPIECDEGYELYSEGMISGNDNYCVDVDECATATHACEAGQFCHNNIGSYTCHGCAFGYVDDGNGLCIDADECTNGVAQCEHGTCVNTDGSYTCDCFDFYVLDNDPATLCSVETGIYWEYHQQCVGMHCENENECLTGNHECPVNHNCYDKNPYYVCCLEPWEENCMCPVGFYYETNPDHQHYSACVPVYCRAGYELYKEGNYCVDLDECDLGTHTCTESEFCENHEGTFTCEPCPIGYQLDGGGNCVDTDECSNGEANCHHGTCVNNDGSYDCDCTPGYELTTSPDVLCSVVNHHQTCGPMRCIDIDECATETDICDPTYNCYNTAPWYQCCQEPWKSTCACPFSRYKGGSQICYPIVCDEGYELDVEPNNFCIDIDECGRGTDSCAVDEHCVNNEGSYDCMPCSGGFEEVLGSCTDVDECTDIADCRKGECVNTAGSYTCDCDPGYEITTAREETCSVSNYHESCGEFWCRNIDECADGTHTCDNDRHCYDLEPFFKCCRTPWNLDCDCPTGYYYENSRCNPIFCREGFVFQEEGNHCVDVNECTEGTHECEEGSSTTDAEYCINNMGSYECRPCALGYELDGDECVDVDECGDGGVADCGQFGECVNTEGTYTCDCERGYEIEVDHADLCPDVDHHEMCGEFWCVNRDECADGSHRCNQRDSSLNCYDMSPYYKCCDTAWHYDHHYGPNNCFCPHGEWRVSEYRCIPIDCEEGTEMHPTEDYCIDINECERGTHECEEGYVCHNNQASYTCEVCPFGYIVSPGCTATEAEIAAGEDDCGSGDFDHCVDYDECAAGQTQAGLPVQCGRMNRLESACVNTEGTYHCTCDDGGLTDEKPGYTTLHKYQSDGTVTEWDIQYSNERYCDDTNECDLGTHDCDPKYNCVNHYPYFRCCSNGWYNPCECPVGRYADPNNGQTCTPVECNTGFAFYRDGNFCRDVDECTEGTHDCAEDMHCVNNEGSFVCQPCPEGYDLDSCVDDGDCGSGFDETQCFDIDECALGLTNCSGGSCVNTEGTYECECDPGFTLTEEYDDLCRVENNHETCIPKFCVDLNECTEITPLCRNDLNCFNEAPFFRCCFTSFGGPCVCPTGYYMHSSQRCYPILCEDGYNFYPDGNYCVDADECTEETHTCSAEQHCVNTLGSYYCQECPEGYEAVYTESSTGETDFTCQDLDECTVPGLVDCVEGSCVNTDGSYTCDCWLGSGLREDTESRCQVTAVALNNYIDHHQWCRSKYCQDFDECAENTHNCPETYNCYNGPGHFACCKNPWHGICHPHYDQPNWCHHWMTNQFDACTCPSGYYQMAHRGCSPVVCQDGYEYNEENNWCVDIDECATGIHDCAEDMFCVNQEQSHRDGVDMKPFRCEPCAEGYQLDANDNCVNINECTIGGVVNVNQDGANYTYIIEGTTGDLFNQGILTPSQGVNNAHWCPCVDTEGTYECDCSNQYGPPNSQMEYRCDLTNRYEFSADRFAHHSLCTSNRCVDIDECAAGTHQCAPEYNCYNHDPWYRCCLSDWDNRYDVNDCYCPNGWFRWLSNRDGSANDNICFPINCREGYEFYAEGNHCIDIDECATNTDECTVDQFCLNSFDGSYSCEPCAKGYELDDDGNCVDIDECDNGTAECTVGVCVNLEGDYSCDCDDGYEMTSEPYVGHEVLCSVDRTHPMGTTDPYNLPNMHHEVCLSKRCSDEDECANGSHICPVAYNCYNHDPYYACCMNSWSGDCVCPNTLYHHTTISSQRVCYPIYCRKGYTFYAEGNYCIDENECELGDHFCQEILNEKCVNTIGSYICSQCEEGFEQDDDGNCVDIDECAPGGAAMCGPGTCVNSVGSYDCDCDIGYYLNHNLHEICDIVQNHMECDTIKTCTDIDECALDTHPCHIVSPYDADVLKNVLLGEPTGHVMTNCYNHVPHFRCCLTTISHYTHCNCPDDYYWSGDRCWPVVCNEGYEHYTGNYYAGNYADGNYCIDIDECATNTHNCDVDEHCVNNQGSYVCSSCPEGFERAEEEVCTDVTDDDGNTITNCEMVEVGDCLDIDECALGLSCGSYGTCRNTEGTYTCDCNRGYHITHEIDDLCTVSSYHRSCIPFKCVDRNECLLGLPPTCEAGWELRETSEGNQCFLVSTEQLNFAEAETYCVKLDAQLGLPKTEGDNTIFNDLANGENIWLGASDVESPGVWYDIYTWYGLALSKRPYTNWGTNQPDDANGEEHWAYLDGSDNGKWHDAAQTLQVMDQYRMNFFCVKDANMTVCPADQNCYNRDPYFYCRENPFSGEGSCPNHWYKSRDNYWYISQHVWWTHNHICLPLVCQPGYEFEPLENICINVDECATGDNTCTVDDVCVDTRGSYVCQPCPKGQVPNGDGDCVNTDECTNGWQGDTMCAGWNLGHSNLGGNCRDTDGSFECDCVDGYRATRDDEEKCWMGTHYFDGWFRHKKCEDGEVCVDVDECSDGVHNCKADLNCYNTEPFFMCCDNLWDLDCFCPRLYYIDDGSTTLGNRWLNRCRPIVCLTGYEFYDEGDNPTDPSLALNNYCVDVDECALGTHDCEAGKHCKNTPHYFVCQDCPVGFELNRLNECVDIDECNVMSPPDKVVDCQMGTCVNTEGSYYCDCEYGFREDTHNCEVIDFHEECYMNTCVDIDECAEGNHNCDDCAYCFNEYPYFRCCVNDDCSCPIKHYMNDDQVCIEIICIDGYRFDADLNQCVDINECAEEIHDCPPEMYCRNEETSYSCQYCPVGYEPSAENVEECVDADECADGTHTCDNGACLNTVGSFTCDCDLGYEVGEACEVIDWQRYCRNPTCIDIDECAVGIFECPAEDLNCFNTVPGHRCCIYEWGRGCACPVKHFIDDDDICHEIKCRTGFEFYYEGNYCVNIDECATETDDCEADAVCVDTEGSYICEVCESGFEKNAQGECVDVNECLNGIAQCGAGVCMNRVGDYTCMCDSGYRMNQLDCSITDYHELCVFDVCLNIDECADRIDDCPAGTTCTDLDPGYVCADANGAVSCPEHTPLNVDGVCLSVVCQMGFKLNAAGTECVDVNECNRCEDGWTFETTSQGDECFKKSDTVKTFAEAVSDCALMGAQLGLPRSAEDNAIFFTHSQNANIWIYASDEALEGTWMDLGRNFELTYANWLDNPPQPNNGNNGTEHWAHMFAGFNGMWNDASQSPDVPGFYQMMYVCVKPALIDACPIDGGVCTNTEPGFTCCATVEGSGENEGTSTEVCQCPDGYMLVGNQCYDIDECQQQEVMEECGSIPCVNENGSYRCGCPSGHKDDEAGLYCVNDNECAYEYEPCPTFTNEDGLVVQMTCSDNDGSFDCSCPVDSFGHEVYRQEGLYLCFDINECGDDVADELAHVRCAHGTCSNLVGGYTCVCPDGSRLNTDCMDEFVCSSSYDQVGPSCIDIDECGLGIDECSEGTVCVNNDGSFICECVEEICPDENAQCPEGYQKNDDSLCVDADECLNEGICGVQDCVNTIGSYECHCLPGYRYNEETDNCDDFNECFTPPGAQGICIAGTCVNAFPGYACCSLPMPPPGEDMNERVSRAGCPNPSCPEGYDMDELTGICNDRNECVDGFPTIDDGSGDDGSGSGEGSGDQVGMFDRSIINVEVCDDVPCYNLEGSYECRCQTGFNITTDEFGYRTCEDIDECLTETHNCPAEKFCLNTSGGFSCQHCPIGYVRENSICNDVDECADGSADCGNGICENTKGGYVCNCEIGYTWNEVLRQCEDYNECGAETNPCPGGLECYNSVGGFSCCEPWEGSTEDPTPDICEDPTCPDGFALVGNMCEDIDECTVNFGICGNLECENTAGSYTCSCLPGFEPFTPVPEGSAGSGEDADCGDFVCNETVCLDSDECLLDPNPCGSGNCTNTDGSYECTCGSGYVLNFDGSACIDQNECNLNAQLCIAGAEGTICNNLPGSYECCLPGFCTLPEIEEECGFGEICKGIGLNCGCDSNVISEQFIVHPNGPKYKHAQCTKLGKETGKNSVWELICDNNRNGKPDNGEKFALEVTMGKNCQLNGQLDCPSFSGGCSAMQYLKIKYPTVLFHCIESNKKRQTVSCTDRNCVASIQSTGTHEEIMKWAKKNCQQEHHREGRSLMMSPRSIRAARATCPRCECGLEVASLPDITCIDENLYICSTPQGGRYTFEVKAKTCHKVLNDNPCYDGGNNDDNDGKGCHCFVDVADFVDINCLGHNRYTCTTQKGLTHEFEVDPNNCGKVRSSTKCAVDPDADGSDSCNCMDELDKYKNVRCIGQDVYLCERPDGRLWRFELPYNCKGAHKDNECAVGPDDNEYIDCPCVKAVSHFKNIKCLGNNIWQCSKRNGNKFKFTIEGNCADSVANAPCDIEDPTGPVDPGEPDPGAGCDCWKHVDHFRDIMCVDEDVYTCTSPENLMVTFKGKTCSAVKEKAKANCDIYDADNDEDLDDFDYDEQCTDGKCDKEKENDGYYDQCACGKQVQTLCDVECIAEDFYICAAEPGKARSNDFEVIEQPKKISRWGAGVTDFVSVKFKVKKNATPEECDKVIRKTGCAMKNDAVCPVETEGTVITTDSKCSCMAQISNFRDVECIDTNTYVCVRSDGESAKFKANDCGWIMKNEMDCALRAKRFCPRWGGGGAQDCQDPPPEPKCSCAKEINEFAEVTCVDDDTFVCVRADGREARFGADKKQCDWIKRNDMGCKVKPKCYCDRAVSRFDNVECINDDQYRCEREDGKFAKFNGDDCDWIYQNKMNCKLTPGPAQCKCSKQVSQFHKVNCVSHDKYQCKRNDGEMAEFSGADCDWIEKNKMDCELKKVKTTRAPRPTTTRPSVHKNRCHCKNEVSNFSSVSCIGNNYYKCRRSDGVDVPFNGEDCSWVQLNVMKCDLIYDTPAPPSSPPASGSMCSCSNTVASFTRVQCIGPDQYICKRHDGKDAKFKADNCDWIALNKMGCATQCSCGAETSAFADVQCIGDDKYMCTRDDGQKAKFGGSNCDWVKANKMGCKLKPGQCPCSDAVSHFADVKCYDANNYVCTRQDGKSAKFPAGDCDWIKLNKMGCAYKAY